MSDPMNKYYVVASSAPFDGDIEAMIAPGYPGCAVGFDAAMHKIVRDTEPELDPVRSTILDRMSNDRIFVVLLRGDGTFLLKEACDDWFSSQLTADELVKLGHELIDAGMKARAAHE